MRNILDHAREACGTMEEIPFSEVDSLILSELSYLHLPKDAVGQTIRDLFRSEWFPSYYAGFDNPTNDRLLLAWCASSPRYRGITILDHKSKWDKQDEMQFSATTYRLENHTLFIAYRGTDTSLVGWKEDFNMAFLFPVPSQLEALHYLEETAAKWEGPLIVGGHSKGGNLAQYATAYAKKETQDRIVGIYSHDGPGFTEDIFQNDGFRSLQDKTHKSVPQSSLIGMLLEHHGPYTVVESNRNGGLMQHDPFSWNVEDGKFVPAKMGENTIALNKGLHDWLCSLDETHRKTFVDCLYRLLTETGAASMTDALSPAYASKRRELLKGMDGETRKFLTHTIALLVKAAIPSLFTFH